MRAPMSEKTDSPTPAHLARNLVSPRHARALTQDALATAASVPRSTIANLESGDGNPSLAVLVKVARALAVPIDELLAAPRAKVRRWPAGERYVLDEGNVLAFPGNLRHGCQNADAAKPARGISVVVLAKAGV